MLRKPGFWLLFVLCSSVCIGLTLRYFAAAFPLVALDLRMDREQALSQAAELARNNGWGPATFGQAASFELDQQTQHFVELEAGGNEAFGAMLAGDLYAPYKWVVRHFQQNEIHEVRIYFTPTGVFYGFAEQFPEDEAGPALDNDAALAIAEAAASGSFGIDLDVYERVEASEEIRPGGRVDHTFVYERPEPQVGEGQYRLRLNVAGERLSGLVHFVEVPEAFQRRYTEMRSANDTIAAGGSIVMVLVYILGSVIGLFFLLRQRWVIWRAALCWGLIVGGLQALDVLNGLPLSWMYYDTALTETMHIIQQLMSALLGFVGMTLLLTFSFMAAESLSRRAFPHHVQLWRLWSTDAGASVEILGRTVGGYLLVGIMFAFVVGFYFLNSHLLGWWNPSEALFAPDVLAVYFPWFTSIARSLQAGFWEECLFRAVPLAGAALLGQRFGRRSLWIGAAFLLQIIVFGAGHANYPAQPAYARVVELIIPSAVFGGLYLAYGLLPAIVMHFAYDVVWFALPLFVSTAPGLWLDRSLVVLLALTPLWIVLFCRWRSGAWGVVPAALFNRAWTPPEAAVIVPDAAPVTRTTVGTGKLKERARVVLFVGGVIGLGLWWYTTPFTSLAPPLKLSRSEAQTRADAALVERQIELSAPWRVSSTVRQNQDQGHIYIWREGGREAYAQLLGNYLSPPYWKVRYARFDEETEVAERAEEYHVIIGADGQIVEVRHQLPEGRPGATLEEPQARALAQQVLSERFALEAEQLEEISAKPHKRPARRDWTFTFRDSLNYPLPTGEARLSVVIAGDEVVSTGRYIHVPEEWSRQERERTSFLQMLNMPAMVVVILGALAFIVGAIVSWSRGRFVVPTFLRFFILLGVAGLLAMLNSWPNTEYNYTTSEPLTHQIPMAIVGGILGALVLGGVLALLAGFAHVWQRPAARGETPSVVTGIALGTLVAGIMSVLDYMTPSMVSFWPGYGGTTHYLPLLSSVLGPISGYVTIAVALVLLFSSVDRLTDGWTRRRSLGAVLMLLLGLINGVMGSDTGTEILLRSVVIGPLVLGLYVGLLRFQLQLVLIAMATSLVLAQIQQVVLNPYPGAWLGAVLSGLVGGLMAWWTSRIWSQAIASSEAGS